MIDVKKLSRDELLSETLTYAQKYGNGIGSGGRELSVCERYYQLYNELYHRLSSWLAEDGRAECQENADEMHTRYVMTDQQPTEPGWYWFQYAEYKPEPIRIRDGYKPGVYSFVFDGCRINLDECIGGKYKFSQRIEEPEETHTSEVEDD